MQGVEVHYGKTRKKTDEHPLVISNYHAQYYACELTRRCPPGSAWKPVGALIDAQ